MTTIWIDKKCTACRLIQAVFLLNGNLFGILLPRNNERWVDEIARLLRTLSCQVIPLWISLDSGL